MDGMDERTSAGALGVIILYLIQFKHHMYNGDAIHKKTVLNGQS